MADQLSTEDEDLDQQALSDYDYNYDYVYFEDDIEVGQLLSRGKSIYHKSNQVCKEINDMEVSSQETIDTADGHREEYQKLLDSLHRFRTRAQTISARLRDRIQSLDDNKFTKLMRMSTQNLQLIRQDIEPISKLPPKIETVYDKSGELWESVQEKFPMPADDELSGMITSLETKIGSLRDLLVQGQEIQNTVNDIGNQQDGFIQQISQTQTETSLMIIDTNTLLKDMVKVTNETANWIKSIVQHSNLMGQRAKDINTAIDTLEDPKYNNFTWYEDVDGSLQLADRYATDDWPRILEPLDEPFNEIYPLYSAIIGQIGNISDIATSLSKVGTYANEAQNILFNQEVLQDKATIEKAKAEVLHREAMLLSSENEEGKEGLSRAVRSLDLGFDINTQNKIIDVEVVNNNILSEIMEVDVKIDKMLESVAIEEAKESKLTELVPETERIARETFQFNKIKYQAIGLAYNQSKVATERLRTAVETQKDFNEH